MKLLFRGRRLPSIFACTLLALAALCRAAEPNAADIAAIDRLLAAVKPGQQLIDLGCAGITPERLRSIRNQLAGTSDSREAQAVTPPGTAWHWPGGVVAFRFDTGTNITPAKMRQFRDACAEWAAFADLTFVEIGGGDPLPANYVTVQDDPGRAGGFSSAVGMAGGEQFLVIGSSTWNRGTLCHEIGHALGYWHEHQREDRDDFVTILWDNVLPGAEGNFIKVPGGSTSIGAYDFQSVMHYARDTLTDTPGLNTIEPLPAYSQFLNAMGAPFDRTLSKQDRAGMATIYGAPTSLPGAVVTNTNDSGPGSLRTAIYHAWDRATEAPALATTITFQIPMSDPGYDAGSGTFAIRPSYLLVAPGDGTTIDGATQAAFAGDTNPAGPEIVLNGAEIAAPDLFAAGLRLRAANCTVKNLAIHSFNQWGVQIVGAAATGNVVTGCHIGTNAAGTAALPNAFPGIEIAAGAHGNRIGGTNAAEGNVISGNSHNGVHIRGTGTDSNLVQGNFIGTTAAGNAVLPNAFSGVEVSEGAKINVIGGTVAGAGNVISGNGFEGVRLQGAGTDLNVVQGNFIGLNATGSTALPNSGIGVGIFDGPAENLLGGTAAGASNVISGNGLDGVRLQGPGTDLNVVQGNFIGVNPAGAAAIANEDRGIGIFGGAQDNVIGGSTPGTRNVISGNAGDGITVGNAGTNGNQILGNTIGWNASTSAPIPNANSGVAMFGDIEANAVGGTAPGASNLIASNGNYGVALFGFGATTVRNPILGNSIFGNAFAGLGVFDGANNSQAAPVLSSAAFGTPGNPGGTNVTGTLTSASGTAFRVEFFASPAGSGFASGRHFSGAATVLTNGAGTANFTANLAAAIPAGYVLTATATDPVGNTSAFSNAATVTSADTDSDGIPNAWTQFYFGHATGEAADDSLADDDADGDGWSNEDELRAGTDPRDPASRLALAIERLGDDVRLTLPTTMGKTYRLEFTGSLFPAEWRLLGDQLPGDGAALQRTDPDALGLPARMYRATVEP